METAVILDVDSVPLSRLTLAQTQEFPAPAKYCGSTLVVSEGVTLTANDVILEESSDIVLENGRVQGKGSLNCTRASILGGSGTFAFESGMYLNSACGVYPGASFVGPSGLFCRFCLPWPSRTEAIANLNLGTNDPFSCMAH